ncbi:MAG: helix-turn-helix domain-containing protein [Erysipelotrichales bacterium]|nr:helix-turn-helix domain-containing protein [Erysipelotrichales bacterium]
MEKITKLSFMLNEKCVNQSALAEKVNVNVKKINRIVLGKGKLELELGIKIAKILGVSVEEISGWLEQ